MNSLNSFNNKLPNKFVVDQQFHRVLTFKERLLILLGYNLRADFATSIDRRHADVRAKCQIRLTKEVAGEEQIRSNMAEEPT